MCDFAVSEKQTKLNYDIKTTLLVFYKNARVCQSEDKSRGIAFSITFV